MIGSARGVADQLDNVSVAQAAAIRRKRKSCKSMVSTSARVSTGGGFAPVMEEDKDVDPDKVKVKVAQRL